MIQILRRLGYRSYKDYLSSSLWISIRSKFLSIHTVCACCDKPANTVHHRNYTEDTLTGKSLQALIALCKGCHYRIEFTNGKKLSLAQANKKLKARIYKKKRGNKRPKEYIIKSQCSNCERNFTITDSKINLCGRCQNHFKTRLL